MESVENAMLIAFVLTLIDRRIKITNVASISFACAKNHPQFSGLKQYQSSSAIILHFLGIDEVQVGNTFLGSLHCFSQMEAGAGRISKASVLCCLIPGLGRSKQLGAVIAAACSSLSISLCPRWSILVIYQHVASE